MKHAIYRLPYLLALLVSCVALTFLSSCDEEDEPTPNKEVKPVPRTVLVYMVATNNLGTGMFDDSDINEMQQAAIQGDLNGGRLVLYHATSSGLVLKEITEAGIDTLKIYDSSIPSVSIERMRQVIADTKTLAPADDYGLVLWSHATGWLQDGIEEPQSKGYRSYGADGMPNAKTMNISSLDTALKDADLAFIYFDCCYMGSVEVVYEMRDCAPYMVVSAAEDPADGMPYHKSLKYLFDRSLPVEEAMKKAAKTTFDYYNDVFVRGDCPCTMAVVRSDKVKPLADITRQIYEKADRTVNLTYSYQKFKVTGVCYYFDLDQYVESICDDEDLLRQWRAALNEAVIYAQATPYIWSSTPIVRYCGLSTYILSSKLTSTNNGYNTLSWYPDVASALFKE